MDRGAWWATVHVVAKSQTRLKRPSVHTLVIQREREDLELAQAEKIPKEDQESSSKYKMPLPPGFCDTVSPHVQPFRKSGYCPNSPLLSHYAKYCHV